MSQSNTDKNLSFLASENWTFKFEKDYQIQKLFYWKKIIVTKIFFDEINMSRNKYRPDKIYLLIKVGEG